MSPKAHRAWDRARPPPWGADGPSMNALGRILIGGGGGAGLSPPRALYRLGFDAERVEPGPRGRPSGRHPPSRERWTGAPSLGTRSGDRARRGDRAPMGLLRPAGGSALRHGPKTPVEGRRAVRRDRTNSTPGRSPQGRLAGRVPPGVSITARSPREGGVSVGFGDGSEGKHGLVVGAGRISSTVRRVAFGTAPPAYAGGWSKAASLPDAPRAGPRCASSWATGASTDGCRGRWTHLRLRIHRHCASPRSRRGPVGAGPPAVRRLRSSGLRVRRVARLRTRLPGAPIGWVEPQNW